MTDSYVLRQIADAQWMVDRIAPDLSLVSESVEQVALFAREVEAMSARFSSPFDKIVLQDRTWTYFQKIVDEHNQLLAGMERHRNAHMLVSAALPKRGWYLSGKEPCTLSLKLAQYIRDGDWEKVDQEMMKHLPHFKMDALQQWLVQEGVPKYCIDRLSRFVQHQQDGNYEEATYIGVPLIDELAKHLYRGRTFTTKRGNRRSGDQSKPELAFKTVSGPDLASYCEAFVQTFGSLQEDPDQKALGDKNYWNRHAIVHGLIQRAMGVKDAAKCLMAINFLFFARKEDEREADTQDRQPDDAVSSTST